MFHFWGRALMPLYRYRLEGHVADRHSPVVDLPDLGMARRTAKFVARDLAAREILSGRLKMSQALLIEDEAGVMLDQIPLDSAVNFSR